MQNYMVHGYSEQDFGYASASNYGLFLSCLGSPPPSTVGRRYNTWWRPDWKHGENTNL